MPRSRPSSSPFAFVACLLPVRDGERELPGWFASVKRFADTVVALDDGSTDDTLRLLEAEPLADICARDRELRVTRISQDHGGGSCQLRPSCSRLNSDGA